MGGNLFKLGRKPRDEYLEIEADVRRVLDPLLGDGYRIPRYYASKPDFGDMDVVVRTESTAAVGGAGRASMEMEERMGRSSMVLPRSMVRSVAVVDGCGGAGGADWAAADVTCLPLPRAASAVPWVGSMP